MLSYVDRDFFRRHSTRILLEQYHEKFGVDFPFYNEVDFPPDGDKCGAQVYHETIEKALLADEPIHFVSHYRDPLLDGIIV